MRALKAIFLLLGIGLVVALTGETVRAAPNAPVTLTVHNPYCVQPSVKSGACYINFRSITASTTDTSLTFVTISIDGNVRLRLQSFFESAIYFNDKMLGDGLQVPCGGPNASGSPAYGLIYSVSIVGNSVGSSPITDVANVTCPFFQQNTYLPSLRK